MKPSVLFCTIFSCIFIALVNVGHVSANIIIISSVPPTPRIESSSLAVQSFSLTEIPVSAVLNDPELAIYFESPVGTATISVYDEFDQLVYQEMVDTYSTPDVVISVANWESGNYRLNITYGSTNLHGEFLLE